MVFFHKYFLFKKKFPDEYSKYLTCCSCVFLSLKVCNQLIPLKDFIDLFLKLINKDKNLIKTNSEQIIFETSEKIFVLEFEILNLIGFDLNVDLPYQYVQNMMVYFTEHLKNKRLIFATTSFINDSFKIPLCLYYDQLLIFLASMHLIEVYFNVELSDRNGVKWYHIVDRNVEYKDILEISMKMQIIYDFSNKENKFFEKNFDDYEKNNNISEKKNDEIINFDISYQEKKFENLIGNNYKENKIADLNIYNSKTCDSKEILINFSCCGKKENIEKFDNNYKDREIFNKNNSNINFSNNIKILLEAEQLKNNLNKVVNYNIVEQNSKINECFSLNKKVEKNFLGNFKDCESENKINNNFDKNEVNSGFISFNSNGKKEENNNNLYSKKIHKENLLEWTQKNNNKLLENNV